MKRNVFLKRAGAVLLTLGLAVPTAAPAGMAAPVLAKEAADEITDENTDTEQAVFNVEQDIIEKNEKVVRTIKKGTWQIAVKRYTCTYKLSNGRTYQELSYEYPVILEDSAAAETINRFYEAKKAAWVKGEQERTEEAREAVVEAINNGIDYEAYYSNGVTLTVTTNDGTYLSTMQSGYDYTMGAHGMPYRICYNFDEKTGKRLTPANILGLTKSKLNAKVRKLYLKKYDKTKDTENFLFYPYEERSQLLEDLKPTNFNQNGYIKNGRLRFYADPYLVGPYAAGFIEVAVKL